MRTNKVQRAFLRFCFLIMLFSVLACSGENKKFSETRLSPTKSRPHVSEEPKALEDLPLNECVGKTTSACRRSDRCVFDNSTKICEPADPSIRGTCAVLQLERTCLTKNCHWDGEFCKEKVAPKAASSEIFIWTPVPPPAGLENAVVSQFALSNNEKHIYAYFVSPIRQGLFYSATQGQTWTELGILRGRPSKAARGFGMLASPNEVSWDTHSAPSAQLLSTEEGVVLVDGTKIFILQGTQTVWALDTTKHYKRKIMNYNHIAHLVKNEEIVFAKIVNTHDGETLVFGQKSPNTVFFKDAAGTVSRTSSPRHFLTRLPDQTPLDQYWIMAGNTFTGNLLLASTEGVWEFPKAHTALGPKRGLSSDDEGVLRPAISPAAEKWNSNNMAITTIGSFNDKGINHYFAGLDTVGGKKGGLAHFKGVQALSDQAKLSFANTAVLGISTYDGLRLVTSQGYKGIRPNGSADPRQDLNFAELANNEFEIMHDQSTLPLKLYKNAPKIAGNRTRLYIWFDEGIFTREKQPISR